MAVLRFFIPWQRVIGFVQTRMAPVEPETKSKDFSQL